MANAFASPSPHPPPLYNCTNVATPTKLELTAPTRLRITWSDAQVREYAFRELRDKCPCATCREKRNAPPPPPLQLPIISAAEAQPLRITAMKPWATTPIRSISATATTPAFTRSNRCAMGAEMPAS